MDTLALYFSRFTIGEDMRVVVSCFAEEMERVLKNHDYKGGWEHETQRDLEKKMDEEIAEVKEVLKMLTTLESSPSLIESLGGRNVMEKARKHLLNELVDLANFCMMMADNYGNLPTDEYMQREDAKFDAEEKKKAQTLEVGADLKDVILTLDKQIIERGKMRKGFASKRESVIMMYATMIRNMEKDAIKK
jgi:hypothetical protein